MLTIDENHIYRYSGQVVPGVSEIMKKGGNLSDYSAVPEDVLEAASNFGTAVHVACHLHDLGTLDLKSLSEPLIPYLEGWKKFIKEHNVDIVESEKMFFSKLYRFAGTIDRIVNIDGKLTLLDIKTPKKIQPAANVQVAGGYKILYNENSKDKITKSLILQLKENDYKLHSISRELAEESKSQFLSCLQTFNWKKKYKIIK